MKALKNYIDKIKPNYEKGGKYEKWMPIFESFETFVFVLGDVSKKGAHIRDAMELKRTMSVVVIALIPAMLFGMYNVGLQYHLSTGVTDAGLFENLWFGALKVLPLVAVAYIFGLGTEFVFVYLKGHEIEEGFLVSGLLIPLIVPVDVPLWMVAVATIFSVIFGKEVFGGTGMNIVNPALLTRAVLFFSYPAKMSGDKVWIADMPDGFSGATALGLAASPDFAEGQTVTDYVANNLPSVWDSFSGTMIGSIGETSVIAILIGAAILLFTGVASWKIILSAVVGGSVMGLLLNTLGSETNVLMQIPWYQHLFLGGFAFGMVFMATDPVTATQTETGKWIYGFLIGFIAILVRVLNPAYPEGVMLAILLMNVFAPLVDHYIIQANIKRRLNRAKA